MNSMPWEPVICEGEIEVELSGDRKAKGTCDGVMLPIESWDRQHRHSNYDPPWPPVEKYWKCHKCGREVK